MVRQRRAPLGDPAALMLHMAFERGREAPYRLLLLGAHADDIEIGCGATVQRLASEYPNLSVDYVVFAAGGVREAEARASTEVLLADVQDKRVFLEQFRDGFFPYTGGEIKEFFERLKADVSPDLILTHCRDDLHQDHRLVNELTWNTWRNHLILEYEIPKWDGDLGLRNFYVPIDEATAQAKVANVMGAFQSQKKRHWFTEDTFLSLMRLRGVEAGVKYAEAFSSRKVILG
jgi:LmbE family N-acetylglucosaminyl deacetylase